MKQVRLLLPSIVLVLLLNGCGQQKNCERLPETFVEAYLPYAVGQSMNYASEGDTMTLVVEMVSIVDSYTSKTQAFTKCAPICQPNTVTLKEKYGSFMLVLSIDRNVETIDFSCSIQGEYRNDWLYLDSGAEPFTGVWQDKFATTLTLNGKSTADGMYQKLDIVRGKGIATFYQIDSTSDGGLRLWQLVGASTNSINVVYSISESVGC